MEIIIKLNDKEALVIQFGRNSPWAKSLYLITIIKETYVAHRVEYASIIKGFFRKNKGLSYDKR